ncbi:hypothetical protein ACUNWD_03850 [Sunxiuqinia sp. A32]|uniref:hypothetical protein n=1 Tax=Sunxiuqinia sp. A32 TaxID=3461496 RepID=UPI004045AF29
MQRVTRKSNKIVQISVSTQIADFIEMISDPDFSVLDEHIDSIAEVLLFLLGNKENIPEKDIEAIERSMSSLAGLRNDFKNIKLSLQIQ